MQRKARKAYVLARKAYVPGLAALLLTVGAGCSGSGGDNTTSTDAKPGGPTPAASPGKYRTLREPCGSVPRATLKDLLPGASALPEDQQEKVYRGTAAVTYDTDRRVGCSWKSDSPNAAHQLMIDVERVVSYDPAVSDDDKAQQVYAQKEAAADLPADGGEPGSPPGAPASGTTTQTVSPSAPGTPSGGTPGGTGTPAPEGLEPRLLDGLGDVAFLDDALARSGSAARNRTVSVVFRTSNVIVTVVYTEQPARPADVPDSKELQEKARGLARKLADQLNE